jgi:hypothetical protein
MEWIEICFNKKSLNKLGQLKQKSRDKLGQLKQKSRDKLGFWGNQKESV